MGSLLPGSERDLLNLLLFGIGKIIYPQHVVSLPRVSHNSMMWAVLGADILR